MAEIPPLVQFLFHGALALPEAEREPWVYANCLGDLGAAREALDLVRRVGESEGLVQPLEQAPEVHVEHPRVPGYRIESYLDSGASGDVYVATQDGTGMGVAIKVLRPDTISTRSLKRFRREAEVLAQLDHAGIARVLTVGDTESDPPAPWIAMEFVHGSNLLEQRTKLERRDLVHLVVQVCDAVHHAHKKRIVHRDLKPSNILVDGTGQPKVLDFGVARVLGEGSDHYQTTLEGPVGTVHYMSPEQARGDSLEADKRSDVYSLGVVLFELLTGELPHGARGDDWIATLRAIESEEAPLLRTMWPGVPRDLESVVAKALEKDPRRRYLDAGGLRDDLARFLRDEPVIAHPPTAAYRVGKWVRRRPALAALVVLAALFPFALLLQASLARGRAQLLFEDTSEGLESLGDVVTNLVPQLGFGEGQRDELQTALRVFGHQLERAPGRSSLAAARAQVLVHLARLDQGIASFATARKNLHEAALVYEKLVERDEDDPELRTQLSTACALSGDIATTVQEREAWYLRAFEVDTALVEAHPGEGEYLEDLGWSRERLVIRLLERRGLARWARAGLQLRGGPGALLASAFSTLERRWLDRAIEQCELRMREAQRLEEADPENWKYVWNLAAAHRNMIAVDKVRGIDSVVPQLSSALALTRRACALEPMRRDFLFSRAQDAMSLAWTVSDRGERSQLSALLEEAFYASLALLSADPGAAEPRSFLLAAVKTAVSTDVPEWPMYGPPLRAAAPLADHPGSSSRHGMYFEAYSSALALLEEDQVAPIAATDPRLSATIDAFVSAFAEGDARGEEFAYAAEWLVDMGRPALTERFLARVRAVHPEGADRMQRSIDS